MKKTGKSPLSQEKLLQALAKDESIAAFPWEEGLQKLFALFSLKAVRLYLKGEGAENEETYSLGQPGGAEGFAATFPVGLGEEVFGKLEAEFDDEGQGAKLQPLLMLAVQRISREFKILSTKRELSASNLEAEAIRSISREMSWGTDVEVLLNLILKQAVEASKADKGAFYTTEKERDELRLTAVWPPSSTASRDRVPLGYGIVGWVAKNATALRAIDKGASQGTQEPVTRKNHLAVPLINEGMVIGVLSLESSGASPFLAIHERILSLFASQASKAIAAALLIGVLRSERDLLDNILGGTPNGVIAVDEERRIVMVNKAARRHLLEEAPTEGPLGQPIDRYVPDAHFAQALGKVLEGNSELETLEISAGSGADRKSYSFKLFHLRRGKAHGATMIIQDLTEQRKLDDQMQRMGRMASIGQLAAGVAHEIRNPLTGISITLDILKDQEKLSPSGEEMVADISREIDRLETLIRGLLDFARPQSGMRRPMRIAKALEWHRTFSEQCRKKGVRFSLEMEADPKIEGDPERLKQLFLNLAINALDATEPGGQITIRTSLDASTRLNERVRVSVIDTGRGMDEATLKRIFDPFFTTRNEGTGLGLSIAHSIAGQHEGKIYVTSAPGQGTTFTVELPCHES